MIIKSEIKEIMNKLNIKEYELSELTNNYTIKTNDKVVNENFEIHNVRLIEINNLNNLISFIDKNLKYILDINQKVFLELIK